MVVHHGNSFDPIMILPILVFLVIYVGIVMYCLNDLYRPERRVNGFTKDVWALIIIIGSILGIMAYFLIGRDNS